PRLDGIQATRRILAERPKTAVLVLTSFSGRPRILGALEAGACGYLLKDVSSEEVAEGIRAAYAASPRWTRAPPARCSTRAASPTRWGGSPPASARCSACSSRGCRTS